MSHQADFEQCKALLDEIQKTIERCREEFGAHFDEMDKRFDGIHAKLAGIHDELTAAIQVPSRERKKA